MSESHHQTPPKRQGMTQPTGRPGTHASSKRAGPANPGQTEPGCKGRAAAREEQHSDRQRAAAYARPTQTVQLVYAHWSDVTAAERDDTLHKLQQHYQPQPAQGSPHAGETVARLASRQMPYSHTSIQANCFQRRSNPAISRHKQPRERTSIFTSGGGGAES